MRILVLIMLFVVVSCKKQEKPITEVVEKTEPVIAENKVENTDQEAQSALGDIFVDQIEMKVDETVFVIDNGTNLVNEDMSAGIMKMLAPQPYAIFKERIKQNPDQGEGITSLGIEEVELGGKTMLFQKSKTVDDAGEEMMMVMYAFPGGEDKTIMISSYYMKNEESKYLPLVQEAVKTAKLK